AATAALKGIAQKDRDAIRRVEAAEAWHRVRGDAGAVDVVTKALEDAEAERRAIAALGTVSADHTAAAWLQDLLDDEDAAVRREAACNQCARVESDLSSVRALRARLSDPDPSVRWWVALALLGSDAPVGDLEEDLLRALRIPFRPVGGMPTHPW